MNLYDVARLRDSATNEYERNHYVRKEDGTTYWIEGPEFDDYYVCAPTSENGAYDADCISNLLDMEFESEEALDQVLEELNLYFQWA